MERGREANPGDDVQKCIEVLLRGTPAGREVISTISKLAYFYRRTFGGRGRLLDRRLIDHTPRWDETQMVGLAYENAHRRYPAYLEMMHDVAADLACRAAQLELFLFSLGNSS